jgi:dolichyl-phosphate-mannose-protein mannosyltransferase
MGVPPACGGRFGSCHSAQPTIAGVTAVVADDEEQEEATERSVPVISPAPLVPVADFGPVDRLQGWVMTVVVTALAAVTRFFDLGSPTDAGTPVFDEKHYAPQAWQMLFNHGVEDNPGFGLVVHPPVGKQLIAIGEGLFGYNGLGWRFSGAVCGVIMVLLVARIARRISRSTVVGGIAGLLVIADGVSFVTARTALLDGFLTLFVVAAFGALMVDRDQVRERLDIALLDGRIGETVWGPRLGVRWWRFGAGVLLGLACATKWSGLYFIAFFSVMSLAFDVAARRQYRVPRPWLGTLRRDAGPTAYAMVLIPFGVYLADYAPWFASETAINRHEVGQSIGPHGGFGLPDAVRSLWHFTAGAYRFHAGLTNSAGNHHPWESKPWTWPMSLRPVLYAIDQQHVPGCGAASCVKAVLLVGTPAMWWLAVPVLGWAAWRAFVRRDWRYAAILVGYCAGFLPWFGDIDRQMYFFYASTMGPFLVLAIAMILGDIAYKPDQSAERRTLGLFVVCFYLALVITNFAWLYPILTGIPISQATWDMEIWLPSWR